MPTADLQSQLDHEYRTSFRARLEREVKELKDGLVHRMETATIQPDDEDWDILKHRYVRVCAAELEVGYLVNGLHGYKILPEGTEIERTSVEDQ